MASPNRFVLNLHLIGVAAAAVVATAVAVLLFLVCPPTAGLSVIEDPVMWGPLAVFALGIAMEQVLVRLLLNRVLKPTGKAAAVAIRVSDGDLTMPSWAGRPGLDRLSTSM